MVGSLMTPISPRQPKMSSWSPAPWFEAMACWFGWFGSLQRGTWSQQNEGSLGPVAVSNEGAEVEERERERQKRREDRHRDSSAASAASLPPGATTRTSSRNKAMLTECVSVRAHRAVCQRQRGLWRRWVARETFAARRVGHCCD